MYTTAATFAAKIKTLQEYHTRLIGGALPLPTGFDIVNTLTALKQSLQVVLKDMPESVLEMTKQVECDTARLALFPALDYNGLFNALVQLMDDVSAIHNGLQEFTQSMFVVFVYLIPFLERDRLSSLPYIAASSLIAFPVELHKDIMNYLIYHILPFAVPAKINEDSYIAYSIPSILLAVLQYSEELSQSSNINVHHCHLLECLMALKPNLVKDILNIIAYGPSYTRVSASKLLFYYWPSFNTTLFDRKAAPLENEMPPYFCQCKSCTGGGHTSASKVCYNVFISIKYSIGSPPPLYLCIECANEIHREHPNQEFFDVLLPMHQASTACENKNCRGTEKNAVSICFSMECSSFNGNHPIRYCQSCHDSRHNNSRGMDHIFHTKLEQAWDAEPVMKTYILDAAVSLLKEARPISAEIPRDMTDIQAKAAAFNVPSESSAILPEERQLISRFGALLLVGLCTPHADTPREIVGRILSILFNWFRVTAYTFDNQEEYSLEKLKKYTISEKLMEIQETNFMTFVYCLLPYPAPFARVGGHWEMLVSNTSHLKNGLNKIYCLAQYNLISQKVWDLIMPHWLEAIVQDVSEKELTELKIAISKILDINQCTIAGFDTKKMYHFIAIRFKRTSAKVQSQALSWLQVLTLLEITLPIHILFTFFEDGINSLINTDSEQEDGVKELNVSTRNTLSPVIDFYEEIASTLSDDNGKKTKKHVSYEYCGETELKMQCCVLMLDVILKQMELHTIERYIGVHSVMAQDIARLLHKTTSASWFLNHLCDETQDCCFCEARTIWHQLAELLIEYVCPEDLAHPPDPPLEDPSDDSKKSPPDSDKKEKADSLNSPFMEINTIMTATVETVVEQLDLAPIILTERVIPSVARSVTLPDPDTALRLSRPSIFSDIDSAEHQNNSECDDNGEDVWHTSVGKFRFSLEDLPPQLQFLHQLLKELPHMKNSSMLYFTLRSLYKFVLHGDILSKTVKDNLGFVVWCQENLIIKNMWELCNAEHSHLCVVCVPILLHCVTLPSGSDIFWNILQDEFHSTDWRVRFVAVERITVMARFMDSTPLRNNYQLQAVLTNAFCYLISSMDDYNELVAQRATLYLGTVHDYAIKSLIMCLETQFDSVIVDRPMVLQSLYQLHNSLSDRKILTWEFFLNRFDTLFIEAQIYLEKTGDVPHYRDLRNFDQTNEAFAKKLQRAQEALSQSQTSESSLVKTLSASFGQKWPYKRTMSAPASMLSRQDSRIDRDKMYNRQFSAPVLKRKSSRFGLEVHNQSTSVGNNEENIYATLHRIIALEETDRETTHLLVFLFMQFLSRADQAAPSDEKYIAKTQNIMLRHLYLLLGYNQSERGFHIPPHFLRMSAVFNSFMSNLPQLLDQNFKMGTMIIPTTLLLLQYCPCPPHNIALDFQNNPMYTLWYLEPHVRRYWITSLFVFVYKYSYKKPPLSNQVMSLIRIVLNTLNAQNHICRRIPPTVVMSSSQQPQSRGGGETPPQSPGNLVTPSIRCKKSATSMETHWEEEPIICSRNIFSSRSETEDTEPDYTVENEYKSEKQDSFDAICDREFKKPVWYLGSEDYHDNVKERTDISAQKENIGSPTSIGSHNLAEEKLHTDGSVDKGDEIYGSPESPLSKMDVHSESNGEYTNQRWTASVVDFKNMKALTLPAPERLLSVGTSQRPTQNMDESATTKMPPKQESTFLEKRPKSDSDVDPKVTAVISKMYETELQTRSRSISPRRLIKQVALESPPDDVFVRLKIEESENGKIHRERTFGNNVPTNTPALLDYMQKHGFWSGTIQHGESVDPEMEQACHASYGLKQSSYRVGDDSVNERCSECGMIKEEYGDDEIGMCLIILGTIVHREPALAAPILHHILSVIAKLNAIPRYSWQNESTINIPASSGRIAKQFLKVIFQQLAPNGIFFQMFRTRIQDCSGIQFFKSVVHALIDFKELCPISPLMLLLEVLNGKKTLPLDRLEIILENMSAYIECILSENASLVWTPFFAQAEMFFRRLSFALISYESYSPLLKCMIAIVRLPGIAAAKNILDPFSKILSHGLQNFIVNYRQLLEVCFHCYRGFTREREKLMLTRVVIFEFTQVLKSKTLLPEENIITAIGFILQDMGGMVPTSLSIENLISSGSSDQFGPLLITGAGEVMRQHFVDALEFVSDFHSLTRIKANYKNSSITLNEDTFGGTLKAGVSQYIALELTRGVGRDNRVLARYFPWMCNTPVVQQQTKEFVDCVGHIRLLSWLLVGSLVNSCVCGSTCQSVPQEVSCYVADQLQIVFSTFPDQSKISVVHMSALFHSFVLCQLWTIYLELGAANNKPNSEPYVLTTSILLDFWGKVTPAILRLISYSKQMSDMVNLHFISVIEALLECRSPSLSKLLPLWSPILSNENAELPGHLSMRLQNCHNFQPPICVTVAGSNVTTSILLKWLQRLHFKMGQIELQASQATQFYTV